MNIYENIQYCINNNNVGELKLRYNEGLLKLDEKGCFAACCVNNCLNVAKWLYNI